MQILLYIFFLVIQLAFAFFVLYLSLAFVTGAPFVPTTSKTAASMLRLARIKRGMKVYDLGSGDGKLLFLAAKQGAIAVGLEINPFLVLYSNIRSFFSPYRHTVHTQWRNFWKADLSDADVVFIYLLPWRMEKLQEKLQQKLKKGTLVISNSFIFPNWTIIRQDPKNHVYVFKR